MSWFSRPDGPLDTTAQVVVVGSGAGGAFAALTLAEAGFDVLVLEEGEPAFDVHPEALADAVTSLFTEAGLRTTDAGIAIAGGRALGGSTVVNSAICFQTPRTTLDEWNELTKGMFSNADAYYATADAVERLLQVHETPESHLSGNDRVHRRAADRLGWSNHAIRRNTPGCAKCMRCNTGCPVGGKASVDRNILPRAAKAGARVLVGTRVERVEPGKVLGFSAAGDVVVHADRIVLSGGAISSPRLLLQSGLAPEGGAVGAGLRIHPVVSIVGMLREPVWEPGATQGHAVDEFRDDRTLMESNPILAPSLYQAIPLVGIPAKEALARGRYLANTGVLVRDVTDGRVGLPRSGLSGITWEPNAEDVERLRRAYRRGAQLWLEGANAEWVSWSAFGAERAFNMAEVDEQLSRLEGPWMSPYSSHPQATCRVGTALDERGELLGQPGIHVMDASSLPSNVGRNPQISVMTVARTLAERLVQSLGGTVVPL